MRWPSLKEGDAWLLFIGGGCMTLAGAISLNPWLFAPGLLSHVYGGKWLGIHEPEAFK